MRIGLVYNSHAYRFFTILMEYKINTAVEKSTCLKMKFTTRLTDLRSKWTTCTFKDRHI